MPSEIESGQTTEGLPVAHTTAAERKTLLAAGAAAGRDLLDPARPGGVRVRELIHRPLAVAFEDSSQREAADHMLQEGVGRLPVVSREKPRKPVGILTRSDLLAAHRRRLEETHVAEQSLSWRSLRK